jgi:hypothetical protein
MPILSDTSLSLEGSALALGAGRGLSTPPSWTASIHLRSPAYLLIVDLMV